MKFKIFIFLLLTSCSGLDYKTTNKKSFETSGFAYIYNDIDKLNKIVSKKFNNEKLIISHKKIKPGTFLKLTNPVNKKSLILKTKSRSIYPDFYKILITEVVAKKLSLNPENPYIQIQEIKKNKSFVASKAEMFNEEKKVVINVPITNVKIDNISSTKKRTTVSVNSYSILLVQFYSRETANLLKTKLIKELRNLDKKKLKIVNKGKNKFVLISGPYNAINLLKNDYIKFKNYGFEELDISISE